jgi:hypothetical protein
LFFLFFVYFRFPILWKLMGGGCCVLSWPLEGPQVEPRARQR